jgi:hypothetical protein
MNYMTSVNIQTKTNFVAFSPRKNYTDRAATGRYCGFSRPKSLLFLSSSSSIIFTRVSGPRSRPSISQKLLAPRNERGPLGSVVKNSDN